MVVVMVCTHTEALTLASDCHAKRAVDNEPNLKKKEAKNLSAPSQKGLRGTLPIEVSE